jgi:FtsP/CotA-like multicopper oxidase with cupredoxin domain
MMFNTPPLGDNGFVPLEDGQDCTEDTLTFNNFATLGAVNAQQLNVLNGLNVPRMITPPGQVERWRIVHAGFLDEVWLGMFRGTDSSCSDFSTADADTLKLTQIGRDGLIMPQPFEHEHFFMSPGYRVEAMIGGEGKLKDGETWCLVAARFLQPSGNPELPQPSGPPTPPTQEDILARFDTNGSVVAILNVTANAGTPTETQLPDYNAIGALAPSLDLDGVTVEQRCSDAADDTAPTEIDQAAVLQVGFFTTDEPDPCDCEGYNVNCANFESANRERYPVDRDLPLGAVEHWRVGASFDGHPFHIHINPFLVCPNDSNKEPNFAHWRDTFWVQIEDRPRDVLTHFKTFPGAFVLHCHKLNHEDEGMMEVVEICDEGDTDCLCAGTDSAGACIPMGGCLEDDKQCQFAALATESYPLPPVIPPGLCPAEEVGPPVR